MFDVITIGTATRDAFIKSAAFKILKDARFVTGKAECLSLGSKINVDDLIFSTGGGATNTAVTFARQGLKVACISRIGDDSGGGEVVKELKKEKIDTRFMLRDKKFGTAYSVILSSAKGERTILVYRGASKYFKKSEIPWPKLKTKWFYITHLSHESASIFLPLLDFAKKNNIKVAINPGYTQIKLSKKEWKSILTKVDVITLNREEAAKLTGVNYKDIKNIFKTFDNLIDGIAVMSDGPNGVWVSDGATLYKAGIYKEKRIIDRTGAGDAFGSGFVTGLIQKNDIEYAIKLGSANATSVVEYMTAKNRILTKKDFQDKRWKKFKITKELL